ncbi:MAG: amidase family protein, partial [Pusillimonas sp.]
GWGGMASDGVLSVTVRDSAAAMDAISGYEPGAPYASPPQPRSFLDAVREKSSGKLRVGVLHEAWNGIAIAPECLAAVEKAASLIRDLGHEVADARLPDIDYDGFVRAHGTVLATNITLAVDARLKVAGRAPTDDDLEPVLLDGYAIGKTLGAGQYVDAIQRFHAIGRAFATAMANYDLILTPTLTQLPAPLGYLSLNACGFWDFRARVAQYATFLAVINASGQPAASLPLSWTAEGVPVAVQLIGRFGQEDRVLELSAQLERAAPWAGRIPSFAAIPDKRGLQAAAEMA